MISSALRSHRRAVTFLPPSPARPRDGRRRAITSAPLLLTHLILLRSLEVSLPPVGCRLRRRRRRLLARERRSGAERGGSTSCRRRNFYFDRLPHRSGRRFSVASGAPNRRSFSVEFEPKRNGDQVPIYWHPIADSTAVLC